MAIRQRGSSYQIDVRVGGKRIREDFPTFLEAEAREAELLGTKHLVAAGAPVPAALRGAPAQAAVLADRLDPDITIKELLDVVWEKNWRHLRAGKDQLWAANRALEFFGPEYKVKDITQENIDAYAGWQSQEYGSAGATINRKLCALNVALKYARKKRVKVEPIEVEWQKEAGPRDRFLTPEEDEAALKIFKRMGREETHDLYIILVDTGIRDQQEAFKLEVRDIYELPKPHLHVRDGKFGKQRRVPLTRRALEAARRCVTRAQAAGRQRLFGMSYRLFLTHWHHMRKEMKLEADPHFVPHILRHTCCSRLAQRGIGPDKRMKWMGHTTIATTMGYTHLEPEHLDGAVEALEIDSVLELAEGARDTLVPPVATFTKRAV